MRINRCFRSITPPPNSLLWQQMSKHAATYGRGRYGAAAFNLFELPSDIGIRWYVLERAQRVPFLNAHANWGGIRMKIGEEKEEKRGASYVWSVMICSMLASADR